MRIALPRPHPDYSKISCRGLIIVLCLSLTACATPAPARKSSRDATDATDNTKATRATNATNSPSTLRKSMTLSRPSSLPSAGSPASDLNKAPQPTRTIYFNDNSSELANAARSQLQLVATQFKSGGRKLLTLVGHTSDLGSKEFSIALAQRRVEAVAEELERYGVPARQIRRISYGSEADDIDCPTGGVNVNKSAHDNKGSTGSNATKATNTSLACQYLDRRVDIIFGE